VRGKARTCDEPQALRLADSPPHPDPLPVNGERERRRSAMGYALIPMKRTNLNVIHDLVDF